MNIFDPYPPRTREQRASALLPYQQNAAATIQGPSTATAYAPIELQGFLHVNEAAPPLSYDWWYMNGGFIGSGQTTTASARAEGETRSIYLRVTDAHGSTWNATHTVCTPQPPNAECIN